MRLALALSIALTSLSGCAASSARPPLHIAPPDEPPSPSSRATESPFDVEQSRAFSQDDLACSRGDSDACVSLANRFARGRGVVSDNARARDILRPLCARNALRACAALAAVDIFSHLTDTASAARSLAERACVAQSHDACLALADARALGLGGSLDPEHVEPLLRASCSAGHAPSCAALALWLVDHAPVASPEAQQLARSHCARAEPRACLAEALSTRDPSAALSLLERACALGLGRACAVAAARLRHGDRAPHDSVRAEELAHRGCFRSVPSAGCAQWLDVDPARWSRSSQSALLERSCLDERDLAVCDRLARALLSVSRYGYDTLLPVRAWLAPACDRGSIRVCATIAAIDSRVDQWSTDMDSIAPLRAACDEGDPFACGRLADIVDRRDARAAAARLLEGACERGDARSCRSLAYRDTTESFGRPADLSPRDRRRAHQWAARGCSLGDRPSCVFSVLSASNERERREAQRASCVAGITTLCHFADPSP